MIAQTLAAAAALVALVSCTDYDYIEPISIVCAAEFEEYADYWGYPQSVLHVTFNTHEVELWKYARPGYVVAFSSGGSLDQCEMAEF